MDWREDEKDKAHKKAEAAFVGVKDWDADVRADCMRAGMTARLHFVADAVLDLAVELVAARGWTMTAEQVEQQISGLECGTVTGAAIRQHISALGARNAVLEADLGLARKGFDPGSPAEVEIRSLRERCEDLEARRLAAEEGNRELVRRAQQAESLLERERKRSAGLERLAAERHDTIRRTCEVVKELEARCATLSAAGQADKDIHGHVQMGRCAEGGGFSERYPCSPTCTHDDAAKPGHPERVKERSEAAVVSVTADEFHAMAADPEQAAYNAGAEAMRAACWEAVQVELQKHGFYPGGAVSKGIKSAIEGAEP